MKIKKLSVLFLLGLLLSCATQNTGQQSDEFLNQQISKKGNDLFIVDCLLPGQIRKLGQLASYITARRAIKTSAGDCEIRGGEYVAYDRANYSTALNIWMPKAQAGDAVAQNYVGEIYGKGLGTTPDYDLAFVWYKKAANQGNKQAQMNLGYLYEQGLGVEQDKNKAMEWYRKSSSLSGSKIPYATTLTSEAQSDQLSSELKLLKAALKNSQAESTGLKNKLVTLQGSLLNSKSKLKVLQNDVSKVKSKIQQKSSGNLDQLEIQRLKVMLSDKTQALNNQKADVRKLENSYQQEIVVLNSTLTETKKRAERIASELKKNENYKGLSQVALLEAEAKLADTEKRLLKIEKLSEQRLTQLNSIQGDASSYNNSLLLAEQKLEKTQQRIAEYEQEKTRNQQLITRLQLNNNQSTEASDLELEKAKAKLIATEQRLSKVEVLSIQRLSALNVLKNSAGDENKLLKLAEQELAGSQKMLSEYEQEKADNQLLIDRLRAENKQIKGSSERIAVQLQASGLSKKKVAELNVLLKKQKQLALQTQLNIQQTQTQLADTEQEKVQLIAQVKSERELKQQYLDSINSKTKRVDELELRLKKEKQQYEAQIKKLKKKTASELVAKKPKIEIIDPPFVLTRGVPTVTLRSIVTKREIIGKVEATAGIMSVFINDKKSGVNKTGLFKTDVKLVGGETPVQVVAVDNNGSKASLNFILSLGKAIQQADSVKTSNVKAKQDWKGLDFGRFHALIIGNNNYKKVPQLETPENDARVVDKVLRKQYGFKTKLLLNGTRYQILSELNKLRSKLTEKDNLLIYYAGHGELDQVNMRGHWLPVDADADNTANWISTVAITDILNSMSVKHILIVSDSCYSGAMTRSSLARLDSGVSKSKRYEWLKAMLKTRSRTVLTSGGLKPVMDGGGGDHSVFAKAFIDALKNNNKLLEGQALYRDVAAGIVAAASQFGIEQVPEYAPIRYAGHESGEFFFVPTI